MVPPSGKPQANGAITEESVRSYGLSRVGAPSPRERFTEHGRYSRHRRDAGHTAVNNQAPALGGEPHFS